MKALIIVDIQNSFMPEGSLEVEDSDKIIPQINFIQDYFDIIIATQDWHPANHVSFISNHKDKELFNKIILENGSEQILWPKHCVQGTEGAQLSKYLHTNKINTIIRKGMNPNIDSYSGFFDNNQENDTGLHGYLKGLKITEVYICGIAADVCVYHTAKDALKLGYKTYLVTDAVKAVNNENFITKIIPDLRMSGCKYITSENLWENNNFNNGNKVENI